jgi:hypothetical protein
MPLDPRFFDGRGCLSLSGIAALRAAPIGAAPPELAGHLASCSHCQEQMLAAEIGERRAAKGSAQKPQPMRTVMLLLLVFVLGAILLATTYRLLTP